MKIYSPQATIPAVAITLATALSDTQPILFTNHFGDKGTYELPKGGTQPVELKWTIKEVEVTLTRDWDISQANIILTCTLPTTNALLPPLPDVSGYRGGVYKYLSEEDEIRIYAGYVDSPLTPITADLLDELPFSFQDVNSTTTSPINYTSDPNKPLCPIFWGFIDKMNFSGDANGGLQVVLACRDRVRVFADTKIISLQSFQGKVNEETNSSDPSSDNDINLVVSGDRVSIIIDLANAAAGNPLGAPKTSSCWKKVDQGMVVRGFTYDSTDPKKVVLQDPRLDPSAWVRTATCRTLNSNSQPRMNVWAERPPIIKGEPSAVLQVLNKSPLEVIDYLAKTEERPMDFFASHINGDYIMGPRVKDTSGFTDASRMYRTYFFNSYPKECGLPSANQMILRINAGRSTLFSFNKFIIIDSSLSKGAGTSLISAVRQGFSALPYHLSQRNPSPPCKTQVVYDQGLASYDNPDAGALLLGLAHSRIWSRDTQYLQLDLIGDPTLYPSESIRVYNTFLHDYNSFVMVDEAADEKAYKDTKVALDKVTQQTSNINQSEKVQGDVAVINQTMEGYLDKSPARVPTNITNLVIPYYTIRSVQHKITAQGDKPWVTLVQAVTDI